MVKNRVAGKSDVCFCMARANTDIHSQTLVRRLLLACHAAAVSDAKDSENHGAAKLRPQRDYHKNNETPERSDASPKTSGARRP